MQNTSPLFNNHPCSRLFQGLALGAIIMAAVAALVVLGDNGTNVTNGPLLDESIDEPLANCHQDLAALPDNPVELPPLPRELPALNFFRLPRLTNAPPDTNGTPVPTNGNPKMGIWHRPPNNFCSANGTCTNNNIGISFTFEWCCPPGSSCFVKVGGGWISLTRWVQFNGGACIVRVGCKSV